MNKLAPVLLLIVLGLVVGYLLGGYVLAQKDYDQVWTQFLSHSWSEICDAQNPSCESIRLDLSDNANFVVENMPERYSLGTTLTGRWDLLIAEENRAMFSLTGLSNETRPQAYVIYLTATTRDQTQLELQWVDATANRVGDAGDAPDDTFLFERIR